MLERGASDVAAVASLEARLKRRWRLGERIVEGWIFLAGLLAIVVLLGIVVLLFKEGGAHFLLYPSLEIFIRH